MAKQPTQEKMDRETLELTKSWALNSGYPLENDVEVILGKVSQGRHRINRDFPYPAKNEEGGLTVRSIDFKYTVTEAVQTIPHPNWFRSATEVARLNLLIEAKFSKEETFWFIPSDGSTKPEFPTLAPMLTREYGRDVKFYRKELRDLGTCDPAWPVAASGRKVKRENKERNSLVDFQMQVLGCANQLIREALPMLGETDTQTGAYKKNFDAFVPIIATNAPLLLLKPGITSQQVQSANTPADLCTPVDHVLLLQPPLTSLIEDSADLSEHAKRKMHDLAWHPIDFWRTPVLFVSMEKIESTITTLIDRFQRACDSINKQKQRL